MKKNSLNSIKIFAFALLCCIMTVTSASAQKKYNRNRLVEKNDMFFRSDEAIRIGDQILAYQRCTGGWPKNKDMMHEMTQDELSEVISEKSRRDDSTTDNGATTRPMTFLARLYQQTHDVRYRDGFRKGIDYLLSGQYANGGWPQFWPEMRDYQPHITYNDDAMYHTMEMLRDVAAQLPPYDGDLTDDAQRTLMRKAFDKGIECILATQIVTNGKLTIWCQQHDHITLKPANARAYELASYCPIESASLVDLLMDLPNPDERVKKSIHAAMVWFDKYKINGYRYTRKMNANGERNAVLLKDDTAGPMWARYYDLEKCEPFVCDRDGVPRKTLDELGSERRNGYSWYSTNPVKLYKKYSEWADKYDPQHKLTFK